MNEELIEVDTDNLVTLTEFAELTGQSAARISQLTAEPQIKVTMWGNRKHIDISKYPIADFKKTE